MIISHTGFRLRYYKDKDNDKDKDEDKDKDKDKYTSL